MQQIEHSTSLSKFFRGYCLVAFSLLPLKNQFTKSFFEDHKFENLTLMQLRMASSKKKLTDFFIENNLKTYFNINIFKWNSF